MAIVAHDSTPGFERTFAVDWINFFNSRTSVLRGRRLGAHRRARRREPELAPANGCCSGRSATGPSTAPPTRRAPCSRPDFEASWPASADLTVLFTPDAHTSLQSWSWTRNFLLLNLLQDVSSEIRVLDPARTVARGPRRAGRLPAAARRQCLRRGRRSGRRVRERLLARGHRFHDAEHPDTRHADPRTSTAATATSVAAWSAATRWSRHRRRSSMKPTTKSSSTSPSRRTAPGCRTSRWRRASLVLDGQNPTQLSGYGGFEVSRTPAYSGTVGRAWLERRTAAVPGDGGAEGHSRGGVYVVANIRGGGEYGPCMAPGRAAGKPAPRL